MKKRMLRVLLMLTALLAAWGAAASCTDGAPNDEPEAGALQTTNPSADEGAPTVLRVAYGNEPPHFDSQRYQVNTSVFVTDPMHATLLSYDKDMNLIPNLATTWDFTGELALEFRIRDNARFHNGEPVTAQDVKDSIERVMDPAVESVFGTQLGSVVAVEVVDDYTVRFLLSEPCAPLLDLLTWIVIIPKESFDTQATQPMGCGPYSFVSWEKGVSLTMKKSPYYWDQDAIGADYLVFSFYAETEAEVAALIAHEVDICTWLPATEYDTVAQNGIELVDNRNATFYYIGMNCRIAPFHDVRVRQAVACTVDKQACLAYILEDNGDICDIPIDRYSPYFDSSLKDTRNIDKAKRLLEYAGYPNGFSARIVAPDTPTEGPLAEMMQQQLAEVGIVLTVERIPVAEYATRVFLQHDFEFTICGYNATGDPDPLVSPYFTKDGRKNIFGYSNPKVEDLLKRARCNYDASARKALYREYFKIMLQECPCVHLIQEKKYSAVWPNVVNAEFHPDVRHNFTHVTFAD